MPSSRQRFVRCAFCGFPHEETATVCPITNKAIEPVVAQTGALPPLSSPFAQLLATSGILPAGTRMGQLSPADPSGETGSSDLVGRTIAGKYRVEALVGRGGMGAVYRAEALRLGKAVAIKILATAHEPGSEAERRFSREARIVASLGHPNIVEIFDLGTLADGAPYQVMELLDGRTLAERLREEKRLAEDDVLDIADQVLSALGAAHERGVVHRDLKPDNVFLARYGGDDLVKLLDFGVSKNVERDTETQGLTRPGTVVGTPYYLSPEQAKGAPVDARADIWAMGVVLYELLTGVLPFRGENLGRLLIEIVTTRPKPPRQHRATLSEAVEALVLRALAFDPGARFQSAAEMRRAIRSIRGQAATRSTEDDAVVLDEAPVARAVDEEAPTAQSPVVREDDIPKSRG